MADDAFGIVSGVWTRFCHDLPLIVQDERLAAILVSLLLLVISWALYHLLRPDLEAPVPFDVPVPSVYLPENYNKLEVLENPSISIPGSTVIQCYCPANGKLLGRINPVTPEGIDRAIEKAKQAQLDYASSSFATRRKVLKSLLNHIFAHADTITRAACLDSGKTRLDAAFGELLVTAEKIQWAVHNGEAVLSPSTRPVHNILMCYKRASVRYEPLGVTAACVSWNYPFHNVLNPIITALITGNALIIKPSERTAHSTQYFLSIARGALSAVGQPPDLLHATPCYPAAANHLTSHPDIAHVLFIGSKPVAHAVASSAARSLTPLTLELGGKDPALVLASTPASDLPRVASVLMRGVFQAAGQNCIGIERIIAQPPVHDALLALLIPRVKALRAGSVLDSLSSLNAPKDDIDVGACISPDNFTHLESLIAAAVAAGATLHAGGSRYTHPLYPKGHYFAPTLLSNVTPDMAIAREELFAPVMLFLDPSYATTTAATIATANAAPFGLGSAVFGGASAQDTRAAVAGLRCGMVAVNDFASQYVCSLPFGGVGPSGYGRFGGPEGLRGVCLAKSVCEDAFGGIVKTGIPPVVDYRGSVSAGAGDGKSVREAEGRRWAFVNGVVQLGFGIGLVQRAKGLWGLLRNM